MKILIVQTGFLGDVILSTPILGVVRELYPDSQIHFLTTPVAAELLRHDPLIDRVLVFDKRGSRKGFLGSLEMCRELRRERYDVVFSLHKSARTALVLRCTGIPRRFGFKEAALAFTYTHLSQRADLPHDVLRNLAIFRALGLEPERLKSELRVIIPLEIKEEVARILGEGPLAVLAPGSVWPTKRWRIEGFAEVGRELLRNGWKLALVGGAEDHPLGEFIERELGSASINNFIGKTTLLQSAAIIARGKVLITNDSAPLHLGSSQNTPVVALFCATIPEFGFGPWQVPNEIVEVNNLSCRPCGRHGGKTCPTGTLACQKDLTAAMVLSAVDRLMARVASNSSDNRSAV